MMLLRRICLIICFVFLMDISVYAIRGFDGREVGKIIEGKGEVWRIKTQYIDSFVYVDSNYSEVAYYFPLRRVMEIVGAEVLWEQEYGTIKIIHQEKEYHVELEELAQEPARGRLSIWTLNEGEQDYIALNEGTDKRYKNYVMYENLVFISLRPDLINLLEELNYSVTTTSEYAWGRGNQTLREYIESSGWVALYIYPVPREEVVNFRVKKEQIIPSSPALLIDGYYYVPIEETLKLAEVQVEWKKIQSEWNDGYYVFRGNRDIRPLACFWSVPYLDIIFVLYEEEDHEYLNFYSYIYEHERYGSLDGKTILDEQLYEYNDVIYMKVEDIDFILNYFGNYKIYADKDSKTVHMERKGLKTP